MRRKEREVAISAYDSVSGNLIPLVSPTVPKKFRDRLTPKEGILGAVFGKYPAEAVLGSRKAEDYRPLYEVIESDYEPGIPLRPLREQVGMVLSALTDRERRVLELRFGLSDGRSRTLKETGEVFGLETRREPYSSERMRQIEAKALRRLRHPTRSKNVGDYLDPKLA